MSPVPHLCSPHAINPLFLCSAVILYLQVFLLCDDSHLDNLENAAIKADNYRLQLHFEDKTTLISV